MVFLNSVLLLHLQEVKMQVTFPSIIFVWFVFVTNNSCLSEDVQSGTDGHHNSKSGLMIKRSDGLLHELFDLTVEQKIERIQMKKEVGETKKKMNDVLRQIGFFKSEQGKLRKQSAGSKKIITTLKQMKKKVGKTKKTLNDIQKQLGFLKTEQEKLRKQSAESKKIITTLKGDNRHLKNKLTSFDTLIKENQIRIAFTAKVNGGGKFPVNSIIPYKEINTNIGGGFNTTDSIFYCPQSGIYMIAASLEVHNARSLSSIVRNGNVIGKMIKGTTSKTWSASSLTIAVHLNKADKVWVQTENKAFISERSYFAGIWIAK